MERIKESFFHLHPFALSTIAGALTVAQFVLIFIFSNDGFEWVRWVGYALWWIGVLFGWLPIFVLRHKGAVPKGKSYVHTTELVDTGLYAVVRHPQMGTAWLLMCLSLILISQHWTSLALGLPAMVLVYLDLLLADQRLVAKFGDAYLHYMARVPRVDFVTGLIRLAIQKKRG